MKSAIGLAFRSAWWFLLVSGLSAQVVELATEELSLAVPEEALSFSYSVVSTDDTFLSMPPAFGGRDAMGLMRMKQVQKELELVDDQIEQIKQLRKESKQLAAEVMRSTGALQGGNITEVMQAAQHRVREQTEEKLAKILLPHQVKRMKELRIQMQLKNRGVLALAGDEISSSLGLSEQQLRDLREKQRAAQAELQERIRELRQDSRAKILEEVLTAAQLKQLESLSGEKFEIKQPQFGNIFSRSKEKRPKKAIKKK